MRVFHKAESKFASAFETMKSLAHVIFLLIICVFSISAQDNSPRFEGYNVSLYQGKIHLPEWIRRASEGEWRDEPGKLVQSPVVNFAGKYFVAAHSCGTGCRYYTMTDLSSGRELQALNNFATAEPTPETSDGYEYLTILYYRPNSKMLIAQYLVDLQQGRQQCRERVFLFENTKLKPITGTKRKCREVMN